ncbi:hypothetical protein J2T09_004889 [Neorhizobium huautlense]|uniref:Uncharacterized protein n=1 Tax=Neorhizobium huautlense TaxID=67774 RepID=A0ABT9Q1W5_9HYPH|nr:hypothetical protein [Neorhizobium huautlense]
MTAPVTLCDNRPQASLVSIRLRYRRTVPTETAVVRVLLLGSMIFKKGAFDTSCFFVSHLFVLSVFL